MSRCGGSGVGQGAPPEPPCWTSLLLPGCSLFMASFSPLPSPRLPTLSPHTGPAPLALSQDGPWNPSNLAGYQLPATHCPSTLASIFHQLFAICPNTCSATSIHSGYRNPRFRAVNTVPLPFFLSGCPVAVTPLLIKGPMTFGCGLQAAPLPQPDLPRPVRFGSHNIMVWKVLGVQFRTPLAQSALLCNLRQVCCLSELQSVLQMRHLLKQAGSTCHRAEPSRRLCKEGGFLAAFSLLSGPGEGSTFACVVPGNSEGPRGGCPRKHPAAFSSVAMTAVLSSSSDACPLLLEHHLLCEPLPEAGGVAQPRGHRSSPAACEGAGLRRLGPHLLTERG